MGKIFSEYVEGKKYIFKWRQSDYDDVEALSITWNSSMIQK